MLLILWFYAKLEPCPFLFLFNALLSRFFQYFILLSCLTFFVVQWVKVYFWDFRHVSLNSNPMATYQEVEKYFFMRNSRLILLCVLRYRGIWIFTLSIWIFCLCQVVSTYLPNFYLYTLIFIFSVPIQFFRCIMFQFLILLSFDIVSQIFYRLL